MTSTYHDLVRDNQWWYSRHPLNRQLDSVLHIVLVVEGRRCSMTHAILGRDGRVTRSFRFDHYEDRAAWVGLRGQLVSIELEVDAELEHGADLVAASRADTGVNELVEAVPSESVESTVAPTSHDARMFGAYLFCDWSASSKPKVGSDSIWFVDGWFDSRGSLAWGSVENPSTRREAERAIRERLLRHRRAGRRTLVGFDFPLGYPSASLTGVVEKPEAGWRDLWQMLDDQVRDDEQNANNRFEVASSINARLREGWYWGTPSPTSTLSATKTDRGEVAEYRLVEQSLRNDGRRPFSVWQLFGNGSVGSQSLVGLPVCERLRADQSFDLKVWPFETGFAAPERNTTFDVLAEVWPGAIDVDATAHPVKDAAQVISLVRWAAEHDASGTLSQMFDIPSLTGDARRLAETVEGWILGWNPDTRVRAG